MEEQIEKYEKWHGKTDLKWKLAVIDKVKKDWGSGVCTAPTLDWVYDDCIDLLTQKTPRKLTNLMFKLEYKKMPCHHCYMIIKYWDYNDEWKWNPDVAHLFPEE